MRHANLLLACCFVLMAGCGGNGPAPRPAQAALPPAEFQQGQLHIRANATPTWQLDETIARAHGIPRSDDGVLLMVGVRHGPEGSEVSPPAQVSGWATDLQGRRHELGFRELRTGELVDQVALLEVQAPDTLHFHLTIVPQGDSAKQLDFVREFHPR